jgi:hypothetical protein
LQVTSNGASQTAAVFQVVDQNIAVARIMRDGTINDATWGGNTIPTTKGGTGLTGLGTALQVLRTNVGASAMEWATISSGGSATGMFATADSETTSSYTATANQLAPINLNVDVTVTAPATPSAGDWFGYYVSNATGIRRAALNRNGNTVNGGTTTTQFNLSARGDYAVWRYLSSTWVPVDLRATPLTVPADITGLQLWLDASDSTTLFDATTGGSLVAADGAVARWEDKSGNARHATQATSGNRPLRKTAQQNGRDTILFDGSNDRLTVSGSASSLKFLHGSANTVFIVVRCGTSSNPNFYGSIFDSTGDLATTGPGVFLWYDDRNSVPRNDWLLYYIWNSGTSFPPDPYVSGVETSNTLTANTYLSLMLSVDPTNATAANRVKHRINGGSATGSNTWTGTASTSNSKGSFTIGSTETNVNPFFGNIAELIIYNTALSDSDRTSVETYLRNKWGLP